MIKSISRLYSVRVGIPMLYGVAALFIGLLVPYEPKLLVAAVLGFTLFLLAAMIPEKMSMVVIAVSTVSVQYIFTMNMLGMDLQSLYKLGLLFLILPALIRFGARPEMFPPLAALFALLLITYLFSDRHPLLTMSAPIKAFIGLAAPFVLLLVKWSKQAAEQHIRLLVWLPLISIGIGTVFHLTGIYELFIVEFNGAFRLQGANIPSHLAFLAYIAFVVSMVEIKRTPQRVGFYYVMMALNFLILLLTGTRGTLLASLPLILLFVFDLSKQFAKGKTSLLVPLFGFMAVISVSLYSQMDNLMKRSFERQTDTMVDLSGRSEAWSFFLHGVKDSPWFGRGLGSVLVANDGSIFEGFVVPHNEYIRFYYDGGYIGAVLLFVSLLVVFTVVFRRIEASIKAYFAAILLGFLIYTFSDNTLSTVQFIVPFCVYLGALVNVNERTGGKEGRHEQSQVV